MQATITTNYTSTSPSPTPNYTTLHQFTQAEGTYEGELKENLKHGLGIFIWQNGDTYFGQWSDNKIQGKGIFCYNTGHYIEGNFSSNLVNGAACLTYPDGSFIKGVFTNGELCGRVIFYQAEKNAWFLQTYEAGKLTEVHYEGSGKPMTYDFCVNIYEEDLQGFSAKSVDSNYRIKSVQRDSAAFDSLGCFDIDSETRHFGVVKNNRITGLGLRIHGKAIEAGKYRDGQLEGFGRRIEFGKSLYEGEFIQGKPYGQGAFYQWKNKTLTVGIFTADMLMQKLDERSFSLQDLDNFSSSQAHNGNPEVVKFSIRTYDDSFAKNYTESQQQKYELNPITTTIKEIEYAKVIARETIIEQTAEGYGPRRHRLQEDLQNHADYIKQRLREDPQFSKHHKRSHSSESNLEMPFSPLFRIGVGDQQPKTTSHRSKSKDAGQFGRNVQRFEIQTSHDLRFNLFNNFSNTTRARNIDVGSPGAIPTFGKGEEANYPSVGDLSPQMLISLGSIRGLSQGSPMTNPFNIQNYSNFLLNSPPSTIDRTHSRSNSNIGLVSPPSSFAKGAEKPVHAANNQYQAKKLNKDRNASKSSVGLQSQPSTAANLLVSQQSPVYHIDGSSTSRSKGTPSSGFSHKHTVSNIQFPADSQSRGWETMRSPSSMGLSSNTPTKKRKAGESPNSTSSRGVNPMIQALLKKGSGSTSTSSAGFTKKAVMGKEKGLCSPDGQLVYVGSTSYAKKPAGSVSNKNENLRSKGKDSSPLGRIQGRKDNVNMKGINKEQEPLMTKSPRISKLLQVQSPTYASDLSLQSYSISEKMRNEKKDEGKQGAYKPNNMADRSPLSARNTVLSANISPRIAPFVADSSVSIKQAGQKTARENYINNDEKLSARSKTPLVTNVNLDLSMFRAKTPGAISDFDCQKTSAGQQLITGRDQSPFSSYRRSESPFADSENLTKGLETQTAARFSFIPENESPYSSITQRETMRSTFKVDDTIQGIVAYKEVPQEAKEVKELRDGKRTPTLSLDLSVKTNNMEKLEENNSSQGPKEKSFHKRAGSQVVLSDLEREKHISVIKTPKFSLANSKLLSGESRKSCETPKCSNRYNAPSPVDLKPIDSALIPNHKLTLNTRVSSSPDRIRSGSPYKIDVQQERLNSRSKSPQQDKELSHRTHTSPCRHSHTSLDSPIGGYPVKKTCDPKMDPYYYEMRQSGQKTPPQRTSPLRNSRGITSSPDKQDTPSQVKAVMTGNSDQKPPRSARKFEYTPDKESGENRISITDIFRKSLTLVQSRAENASDDANFDLKALPTVYSRYENCADSRTFQGFPTKSSNKITESSSPDRQSLNRNRAMLTSYSNRQGQTMSPQKEKEVIEQKVNSSPEKEEEEMDLTERLRECLAKTKANIQMIEKMDRERESVRHGEEEAYREQEFITGVKRSKPGSGNTMNGSVGSSSSGVKKAVNEMKQTFGVESIKDVNPRLRTSSSKGMLSARSSVTGPWALVRDSQSLVNKEEDNRMAFTFRDQKDEGLKSFVVEEGQKAGKDYKRSNSLSKRQSKMGVKSIALYKDDVSEISDGNISITSDVKRRK